MSVYVHSLVWGHLYPRFVLSSKIWSVNACRNLAWTLQQLRQHVCQLTCAEYFARRRPASQPLSQTLSCRACSSSRFKRIRDSFASFIFFSLSARRRSISFLRFRFASVASRSFSFLATRRNSNSWEEEVVDVTIRKRARLSIWGLQMFLPYWNLLFRKFSVPWCLCNCQCQRMYCRIVVLLCFRAVHTRDQWLVTVGCSVHDSVYTEPSQGLGQRVGWQKLGFLPLNHWKSVYVCGWVCVCLVVTRP